MNSKIKTLMLASLTVAVLSACGKQDTPATAAAPEQAGAPAAAAPVEPSLAAPYVYPTETASGGNCALDSVNGAAPAGGAATVASGSDSLLAGWVGDAQQQVPSSAMLVLKGASSSYSVPLMAGASRPDVAAALGTESLAMSGYNLTARLADVAPERYELQILVSSSPATFCPLNVALTVTQ